MEYTVNVWSKAYSPTPDEELFSIQVDMPLWEHIIRSELGSRVFVRIKNNTALGSWIAPMGQPVHLSDTQGRVQFDESGMTNYNIYLPLWMIDAGNFTGNGEEYKVEFLEPEAFPDAEKITLKVVDSAFYNSDVKDELEKALTAIGVIQKYTTLQIPIESLGGYAVEIFVSNTEPANVVLCQGEEVAVEFEEPVDHYERPPTPVPTTPETFFPSMSPPITGMSQETVPMLNMPEAATTDRRFAGQGRTLGDSGQIPEWRIGIPIPRRPGEARSK